MPFDSLHAPPEWGPPRRHDEPERALTTRDRIVAGLLALVLAAVTLANLRMLLGYWHG
jgi:hypothetical protein